MMHLHHSLDRLTEVTLVISFHRKILILPTSNPGAPALNENSLRNNRYKCFQTCNLQRLYDWFAPIELES